MKNKKKKNNKKIPKLFVFKPIAYMQGFCNGRTGTAGVDRNEVIQSGYVQTLHRRFDRYTASLAEYKGRELGVLKTEAEKLILEYRKIRAEDIPESIEIPKDGSAIEQRAAERYMVNRSEMISYHKSRSNKIVSRLIELRTDMCNILNGSIELFRKNASVLNEALALYCKGVLFRKTVKEKNVPYIIIQTAVEKFNQTVKDEYSVLNKIGEVIEYEEQNR